MKFPDLQGDRITLTELDKSGLEDMFEYSKNSKLYRYLEFEPQKTINETRDYLKKLMRRSSVDTAHYWYIRLNQTKKVIGTFGVHDIDWRKKSAEISYGISPDYWGKGYFKETLRVVIDYLFFSKNFYRIFAATRFDNLPSIKGLERLGFKKEATLRDFYLSSDGNYYDAVILAILKHEYQN